MSPCIPDSNGARNILAADLDTVIDYPCIRPVELAVSSCDCKSFKLPSFSSQTAANRRKTDSDDITIYFISFINTCGI